jgi:hypothetical protein
VGTKVGTKVPPLKEGKNEIKDYEDVFLVLPSYAEPFSQQIRQIIFAEKQKLCKYIVVSGVSFICAWGYCIVIMETN